MKRLMLVGPVSSGKTSLSQALAGEKMSYQKTQGIEFYPLTIDTAGEFTQRRQLYSALQISALEADVVGLVHSLTDQLDPYPPAFATLFQRPVIGIITKTDLSVSQRQLSQLESRLKVAGARQIFQVSAVNQQGVSQLLAFLQEETVKE